MHSGTKYITSEANIIYITIKSNAIPVKNVLATNMTINILNTMNMTFEQVFKLQPNIDSRSLLLEAPQNLLHSPEYLHFFVVECLELLHFLFLFVLLFFFVFLKPL